MSKNQIIHYARRLGLTRKRRKDTEEKGVLHGLEPAQYSRQAAIQDLDIDDPIFAEATKRRIDKTA